MSEPRSHPYSALTPEVVLDACTAAGLRPDGRLLGLNSYENRVYQVYLEEGGAVVVKFYRPNRWSREQIDEEHAFARELAGREIPVVAPESCAEFREFVFAVYPRRGGRTPNLEDPKALEWIGRFLGRIHAVGSVSGSPIVRLWMRNPSGGDRRSGWSITRVSRRISTPHGRR